MAGNMARRYAADAVVHEIGFLSVEEDRKMRGREEEAEDEEERVVYYDLEDDARHVPPATSLKARRDAKRPPKTRVLEQPTQLFAIHTALGSVGDGVILEEEEEDDDDDESNPFAALLHKPSLPKKSVSSPSRTPIRRSPAKHVTPPSPVSPPSPPPSRSSLSAAQQPKPKPPRAKRSLSPSTELLPRSTRTPPLSRPVSGSVSVDTMRTTRSLVPAIEAADARPSRWTRTARTATTSSTKRRRESTSNATTVTAIAKQHAETKRRKSMPASLDDNQQSTGGRRLSDVLSKATTILSQDRTVMSVADQSFSSSDPAVRETDDAIADTVTEMRSEPFQTQFFSPSKLSSSTSHRRPRVSDATAVLAKIRGSLGDAIRKATRKTHRDLTLLRSQGQTLLGRSGGTHPQDSAHDVHARDFVIVQLDRLVKHPHLITFDGVVVHGLQPASDNDDESETLGPREGLRLTIVFSASDVSQQLTRGAQLKIFAPFQIVDEWCTPGMRPRRLRKFLIGTSLFEIMPSTL